MAEVIESNIRKTIVDENPLNPKYYEEMSALLMDLYLQDWRERRDKLNSLPLAYERWQY